jgi:DNA-3-methyladenine glycosylase
MNYQKSIIIPQKLSLDYYQNRDVVFLAKDLLGKVLVTEKDGERTSGVIVETEAYFGELDKASHAYGGRRTARTEPLYNEGGIAYVYQHCNIGQRRTSRSSYTCC